MTITRKWQSGVLAAGFAVAAVFGPGQMVATRLGAGETVRFATVSAADTIRSTAVLAEVAAAGVSNRSKIV
jgi:hypothetical protein